MRHQHLQLNNSATKLKRLMSIMGPGLLYAGAAVGVSHLVQSTRAGAEYGWWPFLAIIFIHFLKYPFFKIGPSYALSTGQSLVQGYKTQGIWALWLFVLFTIGTMFAISAAVVSVTAGIFNHVFSIAWPEQFSSGLILVLSLSILLIGKYKWLDILMRAMVLLLTFTTIVAFILALGQDTSMDAGVEMQIISGSFLLMMIKLMGWMPAPLDLSVWHSMWALEKVKEKHMHYDHKSSLIDFKIGYWGTMVLGLLFLGMGVMFFYGSGHELPSGGAAFSKVLLQMYTSQLGKWAFWVVAIAALFTMMSTTFTVMDAIPRSLAEAWRISGLPGRSELIYIAVLVLLALGAYGLLSLWSPSMMLMVDAATVISFCSTPVLALLNLKVIQSKEVPQYARLSRGAYAYAVFCIGMLALLTIVFFIVL